MALFDGVAVGVEVGTQLHADGRGTLRKGVLAGRPLVQEKVVVLPGATLAPTSFEPNGALAAVKSAAVVTSAPAAGTGLKCRREWP